MLRFSGAGVSDVGLVRPHNEDAGYLAPTVCLVADGVGGAAAGEVASATTAHHVVETLLGRAGGRPESTLRRAVSNARLALRGAVALDPGREGLATTLSVLVTDGERVVLGHVGDSRVYRMRASRLAQVSRDHTYVQTMVDARRMTAAEAERHPWRNIVLRTVDASSAAVLDDLDVVDLHAKAGDRFLLCSDGLSDLVPQARIRQVLAMADPRSVVTVLTRAAIRAGGGDNITCLVIDVADGPVVATTPQFLGSLVDHANVVEADPARTPTA